MIIVLYEHTIQKYSSLNCILSISLLQQSTDKTLEIETPVKHVLMAPYNNAFMSVTHVRVPYTVNNVMNGPP